MQLWIKSRGLLRFWIVFIACCHYPLGVKHFHESTPLSFMALYDSSWKMYLAKGLTCVKHGKGIPSSRYLSRSWARELGSSCCSSCFISYFMDLSPMLLPFEFDVMDGTPTVLFHLFTIMLENWSVLLYQSTFVNFLYKILSHIYTPNHSFWWKWFL